MTKSVYIVSPQALPGKSAVAFGVLRSLRESYREVGIFRPIVRTEGRDQILESLLPATGTGQSYTAGVGISYAEVRNDPENAITTIIDRYQKLRDEYEAIVILGSDYTDVISPIEFSLNAQIAANLNAPILLVLGDPDSPEDLGHAADFCVRELSNNHVEPMGLVAINVDPAIAGECEQILSRHQIPLTIVAPGRASSEVEIPSVFLAAFNDVVSEVRTPLMFQHELMTRARADKRTIVLPESTDDRILESAAIIARRGIADLILLGDESLIMARANDLDLDLSGITVQDPTDPLLVERFAEEYAALRAHKAMTIEKARETLKDLSYFGTMMIHCGMADGMVSGAIHTTANTIRPSLEFIKTKPGVALVSGYFLMCLPDRVYVFADCAVNTNPTAENLADIAIASAATASSFGINPRVALLSYSTGTSGSGPDVDTVSEATRILRERAPELQAEGPIQFDAAVDPVVARTKLPDSPVAGKATVFVFPDLNTGNTTYKAVQRTAKALAIGPILQGLKRPVNDLSRGALVDDIVNTIAITAIQAQEDSSSA